MEARALTADWLLKRTSFLKIGRLVGGFAG